MLTCVPQVDWFGRTTPTRSAIDLLVGLVRAQEPRPVVRVDDRELALAGGNALDLVGVAALRVAGEIRFDRLRPLLGLRFAEMVDHRAHQRQVVDVAARARADLSFPARVGELLVGRDLARFHLRLVVGDHARAHREAEPVARRVAEARRDAAVEHRGLHRLEETELVGAPEPAGVDRDQHVGRAARAFVADALDQRVLAGFDAVDLDPGQLGEVRVERLVGLVVARRVEVQHLVLRERGGGGQSTRERRGARSQRRRFIRISLLDRRFETGRS